MNYKLTAENLLSLKETKKLLNNYGDDFLIKKKIKLDLAKTKNYKEGFFYHATGGIGEIGLGKGLYLGKDKTALNNFYNSDGTYGDIEIFFGTPNFIDLAYIYDFDNFSTNAIIKFGKRKNNEHLKLYALLLGYDGIRYYDPLATGEEFILFNTNKLKCLKKVKKKAMIL